MNRNGGGGGIRRAAVRPPSPASALARLASCAGKARGAFLSSAPSRVRIHGRATKKRAVWARLVNRNGGGGGIRTLVRGVPVNGFRDRRIQPLCHSSAWSEKRHAIQMDACRWKFWRRVRDLNPGDAFGAYTISNRAPSATRTTLRECRGYCTVTTRGCKPEHKKVSREDHFSWFDPPPMERPSSKSGRNLQICAPEWKGPAHRTAKSWGFVLHRANHPEHAPAKPQETFERIRTGTCPRAHICKFRPLFHVLSERRPPNSPQGVQRSHPHIYKGAIGRRAATTRTPFLRQERAKRCKAPNGTSSARRPNCWQRSHFWSPSRQSPLARRKHPPFTGKQPPFHAYYSPELLLTHI